MKKVESPLLVDSSIGKVLIADNNYKNLIFAPKDNPYFVDMKLDVCIPSGYEPTIMDEDELKEVYEYGLITKDDFNKAYYIANKIINTYKLHKNDYYKFIYSKYNKFKSMVK